MVERVGETVDGTVMCQPIFYTNLACEGASREFRHTFFDPYLFYIPARALSQAMAIIQQRFTDSPDV